MRIVFDQLLPSAEAGWVQVYRELEQTTWKFDLKAALDSLQEKMEGIGQGGQCSMSAFSLIKLGDGFELNRTIGYLDWIPRANFTHTSNAHISEGKTLVYDKNGTIGFLEATKTVESGVDFAVRTIATSCLCRDDGDGGTPQAPFQMIELLDSQELTKEIGKAVGFSPSDFSTTDFSPGFLVHDKNGTIGQISSIATMPWGNVIVEVKTISTSCHCTGSGGGMSPVGQIGNCGSYVKPGVVYAEMWLDANANASIIPASGSPPMPPFDAWKIIVGANRELVSYTPKNGDIWNNLLNETFWIWINGQWVRFAGSIDGKWLPNVNAGEGSTGVTDGGSLAVNRGAKLDMSSSAKLNMIGGAEINMSSGGKISFDHGTLNMANNGKIDVSGNGQMKITDSAAIDLGNAARLYARGAGAISGLQNEFPVKQNAPYESARVYDVSANISFLSVPQSIIESFLPGDLFYFIASGSGGTLSYKDIGGATQSEAVSSENSVTLIMLGYSNGEMRFRKLAGIGKLLALLDKNVQTHTKIEANESNIFVTIELTNIKTGEKQTVVKDMPLVTETQAGGIDPVMYNAFLQMQNDIAELRSSMQGLPRIAVIAGMEESPEQEDITEAFIDAKGSAPNENDRLVNVDFNAEYIFSSGGEWLRLGGSSGGSGESIGFASPESAGLAKHSAAKGAVSYFAGDGVGQLNGYDELVADIEANATNLSNAVKITGDQSINGVKTFSQSPVVPMPTEPNHAANKDYADGIVGAFAVPDYARMEGSKISTDQGSWTADRSGFIRVGFTAMTSAVSNYFGFDIYINGVAVNTTVQCHTAVNWTVKYNQIIPVKKGDKIVLYYGTLGLKSQTVYCNFIPPYVVTQEQLQQENP